MDEKLAEIPKSTKTDHLHTMVRAGLGMLPVVGNPAAELFNSIITPPIEKRRDEWRQLEMAVEKKASLAAEKFVLAVEKKAT